MTGWHEGALAGFDLETTGADPATARIVTAAVVIRGGGRENSWDCLVDPGIEIPAEATAVHGITTEKARAHGIEPKRAAGEIATRLAAAMLDGIPVVIYNAPYDLTLLDRETQRHGLEPFGDAYVAAGGAVIDPLVLDKHLDPYRRGKRTLTAACAHYRVSLDGAHDAGFDAIAAMRVAWRIAVTHPAVASMSVAELHELQVKAKVEQAASFEDYLRRQGKAERIDRCWPLCTCPDGEA